MFSFDWLLSLKLSFLASLRLSYCMEQQVSQFFCLKFMQVVI
nr:MAG TPA: hypothetical protein [Caudoviricetes sp.]